MTVEVKNSMSKALVIGLIVLQLVLSSGFLLIPPKKAQAFWGVGDFDFTTKILDIPKNIDRIVEGLLVRIGTAYANKYLTKFVQKLQDKYRIKDFLFYDRYLTNYYISNLILKDVKDPDLKRALELMSGVVITGETFGYTGTDPSKAYIPQLKVMVNQIYEKSGAVPTDTIFNPPASMSNVDYYAAAESYWLNPPSYTEQNLWGQYGAFQSEASTSAQLEIAIGNGLKAGRVIGGTCSFKDFIQPPPQSSPRAFKFEGFLQKIGLVSVAHAQVPGDLNKANKDPVSCAANGGRWEASLVDQARSFITNPTTFVEKQLTSAVNAIFKNNYDASNIYTQIGQALGDFVFTSLNLNDSSGVFNEPGYEGYNPNGGGSQSTVTKIDLDADGIPDGQDNTRDNKLESPDDTCFHQNADGTPSRPPNCARSTQVPSSKYFTPLCQATDDAILEVASWGEFMERNKSQAKGPSNFFNESDAVYWARKGTLSNGRLNELLRVIEDFGKPDFESSLFYINKYNIYLESIIQSLIGNADVDLRTGFGTGDGGTFYSLRVRTENMLQYLKDFKAAFKRCDNPDAAATKDIPPPDLDWTEPIGSFRPCDNPPNTKSPDPMPIMLAVRAQFPDLDLTNESPGGGRDLFTAEVAWRLSQNDPLWGRKKSSATAPLSTDTLGYLRPDVESGRFEGVDIVAGGSGNLQRGCYGVMDKDQVWVAPEPSGLCPVSDTFGMEVCALYKDLLGRVPSKEEIDSHRGNPGGIDGVRQVILDSPEYKQKHP